MKITEDLGQILVVLHTLLVIIEMPPRLNKQSETHRDVKAVSTAGTTVQGTCRSQNTVCLCKDNLLIFCISMCCLS